MIYLHHHLNLALHSSQKLISSPKSPSPANPPEQSYLIDHHIPISPFTMIIAPSFSCSPPEIDLCSLLSSCLPNSQPGQCLGCQLWIAPDKYSFMRSQDAREFFSCHFNNGFLPPHTPNILPEGLAAGFHKSRGQSSQALPR